MASPNAAAAKKPGRAEHHAETIVKRSGHKGHDEGHGGAWKVAFADFCLALLSLFLVLWLMAARQQEHVQEVMRSASGSAMGEGQDRMAETVANNPPGSMIERMPVPRPADPQPQQPVRQLNAASAPGNATGTAALASQMASASTPTTTPATEPDVRVRYDSPADLQALSKVLHKLSEDAGLSGNLQTVITAYGLRVMLHDNDKQGMFERGSSAMTERFRTLLRKMGPLFAKMSNQMLIVGHTDATPFANRSYGAISNWTLSTDRAIVARGNLMAGGMPTESVLQVVGMADRAPIDTEDANADVNRRIELLILTTSQARAVSAMFGQPGSTLPLGGLGSGAGTALPDASALQALRGEIGQGSQSKGRTVVVH